MKFNPVLAGLSLVIAALLGFLFHSLYPSDPAVHDLRIAGTASTFVVFAAGLVGALALGAPSGRVKALVSTVSVLFLGACLLLVPALGFFATGVSAFVIGLGLLTVVYAVAVYGLMVSGQ
jgi:hypothetical protein